MAAKEKVKEPEKKEVKEAAKAPEKEDFKVRHLTPEETKTLMDDKEVPEGYVKASSPTAIAVEEPPAEKKPDEKKGEKPAEKEPEGEPSKEDFFEKLERETAKPEGKEDLADFTPREKAYFYRMRRDRKLRQNAEEDRDKALFRETKLKEETAKKPVEEEEPFKGKDPDDFLTVKEAREAILKQKEKPKTEEKIIDANDSSKALQVRYLQLCEKEARQTHTDFDAVMELADDLVVDNQEALKDISDRTRIGENPAIVMYEVIKSHKDFENLYPAAELRAKAKKEAADKKVSSGAPSSVPATPTPEDKAKEEKAKQAEKTLEENTQKPKTTAHASSREGKPAEELNMEEIAAMSDGEFAKLPRGTRQRYLRMYGT